MSKRACGILLFILIVGVAVRMQYSFCQSDECFYIAMANRMSVGQCLIRDEWHPTQFYVPILYLFYYPYKILVPSVEGVIIYFRIVYLIINSLISYWLFSEQYDSWGSISIVPAVINILYVHGNIMGMSYYGLCVQFMIAFLLSVKRCHKMDAKNPAWSFFSGLMLSLAVLCCPFLCLFVIPYAIALLFIKNEQNNGIGTILGLMMSALNYLLWLFKHIQFSDIIENIRYVVSDPQHTQGILDKLIGAFQASREYISIKILLLEILLIAYMFIFYRRARNIREKSMVAALLMIVICNVKSVYLAPKGGFLYSILYTTAIGGLPLVLQYWRDNKDRYIIMFYMTGLAVAFSFLFASNTILVTMAVGCSISSMAVIIALDNCVRSICYEKLLRISCDILKYVIIYSIVITLLLTHFIAVYRDAPIKDLNQRLTRGPAKWLMTTNEHANQYYTIEKIIRDISAEQPVSNVLHSSKLPWAYLCSEWKYAAPTSWTTTLDDPRLLEYYNEHPDNKPDFIFIYAENVGCYESTLFNLSGGNDTPNTNNSNIGMGDVWNNSYNLILSDKYVKVYGIK